VATLHRPVDRSQRDQLTNGPSRGPLRQAVSRANTRRNALREQRVTHPTAPGRDGRGSCWRLAPGVK
jgi:hypothetical protein